MPQATLETVVGIGKETVYGTPVTPAAGAFLQVTSAPKPKDALKMEEDKGWRGSAGEDYGLVPGTYHTEYDFGGNVKADTIGFPLAGVLGDVVYSATPTTPNTTLTTGVAAGLSALPTATGLAAGLTVQIDTGLLSEIRTTAAPSGTTTNLTVPLSIPHQSGVTVTAVTTPNSAAFSVLNAGNFQPSSYTFTDFYGVGTRQYPGAVFSECAFKIPADGLLTYSAKAMALPSVPTTQPIPSYTSVKAIAGWSGVAKFAGVTTGVKLASGDITLKRKTTPIQLVNGVQAPSNIWASAVGVDFKFELIAEDDTHLTNYLTNAQPSFDLTFTQGAGASLASVGLHLSQAGYTAADIDRGKDWIQFSVSGKGLFNASDAGRSGGFSPIKATIQNAVTAGTY